MVIARTNVTADLVLWDPKRRDNLALSQIPNIASLIDDRIVMGSQTS